MYESYALKTNINEILQLLAVNHPNADKKIVRKAFETAKEQHKNQFRKTGEPYILHPLRVAKLVAGWGFESTMICAALLHDVVEDCKMTINELEKAFNPEIAGIVDTLTEVNQELKSQGLTKDDIDRMSDARLLMTMSTKALFIKAADRIDNLNTISIMPPEKQIKKARHTRDILIPYIMKEGSYSLVDELEELCFKIEHADRYHEIQERYAKLRKVNEEAANEVIRLFTDVYSADSDSDIIPEELKPYQKGVIDFYCMPRTTISVFRQLSREASNLKKELPELLMKKTLAQYDFTLLIDEDILPKGTQPNEIFERYYDHFFRDHGITLAAHATPTSHQDSVYLVLSDDSHNLYRLFIRTKAGYRKYRLGNFADADKSISLANVDDIDPKDSFRKTIKIFLRNGQAMQIDAEATVLDLAFKIHTEIGLHFSYALIDSSSTRTPAHVRLSEGDQVTIVTSDDYTANLQWFRYLKTNKATLDLVKYLQKAFDEAGAPEELIKPVKN